MGGERVHNTVPNVLRLLNGCATRFADNVNVLLHWWRPSARNSNLVMKQCATKLDRWRARQRNRKLFGVYSANAIDG